MVDLFSRHDNSTFKTHLTEGMLRSILVTDPLPCTSIPLLRRLISAVLLIITVAQLLMLFTESDEMTTIGYAANYAAKLQNLSKPQHIMISEDMYDDLVPDQKLHFRKVSPVVIRKYGQENCYDAEIKNLQVKYNFRRDLERAEQFSNRVDLQDMNFRSANQPLNYKDLSKTECKK